MLTRTGRFPATSRHTTGSSPVVRLVWIGEECQSVGCWIAPRDITPGDEWGAAIVKGLNASRIMVLIFSGHANASVQVGREVERAISQGMTVLPVRIEDVPPEGVIMYALAGIHWLDAFALPVEQQLELLARSVKTLLANDAESPAAPAPAKPTAVAPAKSPQGSRVTSGKPARTKANSPMEGAPVISVFVSYRREDSRHQAGRLYDHLVAQFGKGQVFKDVDSIPLGLDFREVLTERVAACDVFLAVIGDEWLSIAEKSGTRRLDDPGDFVRIEIEATLSRKIPVIPVLVGDSSVPQAEKLPESLRGLSFRNGLAVRPDPDFHSDVDRLIRGIYDVVSTLRERSAPRGPKTQKSEELKSADEKSSLDLPVGSSEPRRPEPDFVNPLELVPVISPASDRGQPAAKGGGPFVEKKWSTAGQRKNEEQRAVSTARDSLVSLSPRTGIAAVTALDGMVGSLNVALGCLATVVLSVALYCTLGAPTRYVSGELPWSGEGTAVLICFVTGISLGVVQVIAGRSLLKMGHPARKFAIRHAMANVAVLVLFYLFGLLLVPKIESTGYVMPPVVLIVSCLYPAAVWRLLSRPTSQAQFKVAPKTHP
ncbi:MAG: toll/interleukin-1 receptor domain-containing protein [Isosphaeraceae bacterium]